MKKESNGVTMRPEYDFSKGVKGKYAKQLAQQGEAVKALLKLKGKLNWDDDLNSMRKNRQ